MTHQQKNPRKHVPDWQVAQKEVWEALKAELQQRAGERVDDYYFRPRFFWMEETGHTLAIDIPSARQNPTVHRLAEEIVDDLKAVRSGTFRLHSFESNHLFKKEGVSGTYRFRAGNMQDALTAIHRVLSPETAKLASGDQAPQR